jgi:hypothetical protein
MAKKFAGIFISLFIKREKPNFNALHAGLVDFRENLDGFIRLIHRLWMDFVQALEKCSSNWPCGNENGRLNECAVLSPQLNRLWVIKNQRVRICSGCK